MASSLCAGPLAAGAFLLPEGQGQFIAGVGYSEGSHRFDPNGASVSAPSYRRADASGYLEYGLTSWLNLIATPTLAHQNGTAATNSVTGSDSSAFGARLKVFGTDNTIVALQALIQPPLGSQNLAAVLADGGADSFAADLRVLVGRSFPIFGLPAFIDAEPGVRLRADPLPTEVRLDLTLGVRPIPNLMILVQDFSAVAPSADPLLARTVSSKLQGSIVCDIAPAWSLQMGGFRTVAGRNTIRETGPLAALWYRF